MRTKRRGPKITSSGNPTEVISEPPPPPPPPPDPDPDPPPSGTVDPSLRQYFGIYTGNYDPAEQLAYENWIGHPIDWAKSFYPFGNSASTINNAKANTRWKSTMNVRLYDGGEIASGTRPSMLQAIANGSQDGEWREVAQNLVNANLPYRMPLLLGHECNGDWYAWSTAAGQEHLYVAAFRQAVSVMRSVSGFTSRALIAWNTSCGAGKNEPGGLFGDAEKQYPGNDVVDIVSCDIYSDNRFTAGSSHSATLFDGPRAFDWSVNWARSHGKQFAVDEWSVRDVEDVTFIDTMHAKLSACEHLHHHIQYDFHDYHKLSPPTIFPNTSARFKLTTRFG